jgi:hypothetical protein
MCSLCAALASSRLWTDAAGHEVFSYGGRKVTRREERERRVDLLNRLFDPHRITIKDWGGNSFVIENERGCRENAYNLLGIWSGVETLCGLAIDPLDEVYLDRLEVSSVRLGEGQ